jgi:hypothetical protein
MSEERITLNMFGELMLNMQADLQVVSAAMLRLDRSIDRLERDLRHEIQGLRNEMQGVRDEMQGVRDEMHEIRGELRVIHRQGQRTTARVRRLEEGEPPAKGVE